MLLYLLKRIAGAVITLLLLVFFTFWMMKVVPGGPFDSEKALPASVKVNLEAKYHLHDSAFGQFKSYLRDLVHFDLGVSYRYMGSRTVNEIILETLPISAFLGIVAILVSLLIGIPAGVVAAYRQGSRLDHLITLFSSAGLSLPNFLVASVLVLVFAVKLNWFPPALWEGPLSAVIPITVLALRPLALVASLTRATMLDVLKQDFIRTAYAKGLSVRSVLFKHALKNSVLPIISLLAPLAASVVTGSFVVEMIFAIPGLGKHFVSAVLDRDYPLVMGVTLVYGFLLIGANFLADVLYGVFDSRVRVTSHEA